MDEIEYIPIESVLPFAKDVLELHHALAAFFKKCGDSPVTGSPADHEVQEFGHPVLVKTAYAQANLLLNSADDHMVAFTRVVIEPLNSIAAWTLVRGAVEAAAMSAWLFDPRIDPRERVKRSYAYRFEGMEQERKLCNAIGKDDETKRVARRLDQVEEEATSLGYPRILNNSRKRIGIGMTMPSNTTVIQELYGEDGQYRLLSAMAHSLPFATSKLAHRPIRAEAEANIKKTAYHEDLALLERHMSVVSFSVLCHWLMLAIVKPVWFYTRLFGFDEAKLAAILDEKTENHIKPDRRFWRTS